MITNTDYIKKWIEKSRNEEDFFDKFVYGFFALNAMYSVHSTNTSERKAIKNLFNDCFDYHRNEFIHIFDMPEYSYFCGRRPIKNMRYNPDDSESGYPDTKRDTETLKEKDPKRSNRSMLMILYQIRCNLFHGNKSFNAASDQEVMRNASELLLKYNEIFANHYL